jgi:hypothetical protein
MTTDHLLFAALGGVLAVVVAVWMTAVTNAIWALVIAVAVAVAGEVLVVLVISRELADADGIADADDPRHAEYAPRTDDGG